MRLMETQRPESSGTEALSFEEVLARYGRLVNRNVGVSMMPLLREGKDLMIIEPCDTEKLQKYDAVLFRRPNVQGRGAYVLHRILKRFPDGRFWIVGDNCISGEKVRPEQILGRLSGVVRGGRTVKVTNPFYRLYILLWCAPWPLRMTLLRLRYYAGRVYRRLRKLLSGKAN